MDDLSPQEHAVYAIVAANPFAGQADIAETLGLARSTVAAHIVSLIRKGYVLGRGYVLPQPKRIVCLGAAAIDRKYHADAKLVPGTSNPARGSRSFGGVARNVVENLARLGVTASFVSLVGDDENGREILRQLRELGVDTSQVATSTSRATAEYVAILDRDNDLAFGIADMAIFDQFGLPQFERVWPHLAAAAFVFADCNLPAEVLATLIERARTASCRLAINTVSAPKAARLPTDLSGIDLLFVNRDEAAVLLADPAATPDAIVARLRGRGAARVVLTLGAEGCLLADAEGSRHIPARRSIPRDVTGAGDALIAGVLYRLLAGEKLVPATITGSLLAGLTVESDATVLPALSAEFLDRATP